MPQDYAARASVVGEKIFFLRQTLGTYLKNARLKMGFSLRDIEQRCGVSDSEIFKIESGNQDCRLETFVRLCAALGISWGQVLDDMVCSNFVPFADRLDQDPLIVHFTKRYPEMREYVASNVAMICALAVHLVHCSDPVARAGAVEYPSETLKQAFSTFAQCLRKKETPAERLSVIASFESEPMQEMIRHGLFSAQILTEFVSTIADTDAKEQPFMGSRLAEIFSMKNVLPIWTPFLPPLKYHANADPERGKGIQTKHSPKKSKT